MCERLVISEDMKCSPFHEVAEVFNCKVGTHGQKCCTGSVLESASGKNMLLGTIDHQCTLRLQLLTVQFLANFKDSGFSEYYF